MPVEYAKPRDLVRRWGVDEWQLLIDECPLIASELGYAANVAASDLVAGRRRALNALRVTFGRNPKFTGVLVSSLRRILVALVALEDAEGAVGETSLTDSDDAPGGDVPAAESTRIDDLLRLGTLGVAEARVLRDAIGRWGATLLLADHAQDAGAVSGGTRSGWSEAMELLWSPEDWTTGGADGEADRREGLDVGPVISPPALSQGDVPVLADADGLEPDPGIVDSADPASGIARTLMLLSQTMTAAGALLADLAGQFSALEPSVLAKLPETRPMGASRTGQDCASATGIENAGETVASAPVGDASRSAAISSERPESPTSMTEAVDVEPRHQQTASGYTGADAPEAASLEESPSGTHPATELTGDTPDQNGSANNEIADSTQSGSDRAGAGDVPLHAVEGETLASDESESSLQSPNPPSEEQPPVHGTAKADTAGHDVVTTSDAGDMGRPAQTLERVLELSSPSESASDRQQESQSRIVLFPRDSTEQGLTDGLKAKAAAFPGADGASARIDRDLWESIDSTISDLVASGRDAHALAIAETAEPDSSRSAVMAMFTQAFSCVDQAYANDVPILVDHVERLPVNEARVALAGALRLGLAQGYSAQPLEQLLDRAMVHGTDCGDVSSRAVAAVRSGWIRPSEMSDDDALSRWSRSAGRAAERRETLANRKSPLARASSLIHFLARPDQPVGAALTALADVAKRDVAHLGPNLPEIATISEVAATLSDNHRRERLIKDADAAVSTLSQRRNDIVAVARRQIDDDLDSVRALLIEAMDAFASLQRAKSSGAGHHAGTELRQAVDRLASLPGSTVGEAALARLVRWVRTGTPSPAYRSLEDARSEVGDMVAGVPRDVKNRPSRAITVGEFLDNLDTSADAAVRAHLHEGNIALARKIAARTADTDLGEEFATATRRLSLKRGAIMRRTESAVARLRSLADDDSARALSEELERLRKVPVDRADLALSGLEEVSSRAEALLDRFAIGLEIRLDALECTPEERERVHSRVEAGDEVTALEFVSLLEAGQPLPSVTMAGGEDFQEFFPRIVEVAAKARAAGLDAISAVRTASAGAADPSRQAADGVSAWREISRSRATKLQEHLPALLRMLGLTPRTGSSFRDVTTARRAGYKTWQVKADHIGGSYVPQFGSQANATYDVTIVWEPSTPTRLLDYVAEGRRNAANVILYFGVLDAAARRDLRRATSHTGGKGFSPLVIDEAVIAWLATRGELGWKLTQRVTLPFTTLNPYTPFAAGEVPEEVFVGRTEQRHLIESPSGSMFVYGGRQLGKSALLRRVEKLYPDNLTQTAGDGTAVGRRAVYLDLRAHSIGEAQAPAVLWQLLGQRLRDAHILSEKVSTNAGPQVIVDRIRTWILSDDSNALLLLLDEADLFLTADSRNGFAVLNLLKGLMTDTGRRFKAVFAGLHQVQRFHDASNTPVAHGGADICIGPLEPIEARDLVLKPLRALGYELESTELVWRLLLPTNYQPALVQIVCEALVGELKGRAIPIDDGRVVVSGAEIDAIIRHPKVRERIGQRFRWTINLDNRYRVIALVVALLTLDPSSGTAFSPDDIQALCQDAWPGGFGAKEPITAREFAALLDELIGLGVLHRRDGKIGLRSPNVLSLLGSREDLERELTEASATLEMPYEYNPALSRREIVPQGSRSPVRSPLTDQDLAAIVGVEGSMSKALSLVIGTAALGIDRVGPVLSIRAQELGFHTEFVSPSEVRALVASRSSGARFLIVDLTDGSAASREDVRSLLQMIGQRPSLRGAIILPAKAPAAHVDMSEGQVVRLQRWSNQSLRAWHDLPFDHPDDRSRLWEITHGWPQLVEAAVAATHKGTPSDVLVDLEMPFSSVADAASFIDSVGVGGEELLIWRDSFVLAEGDEFEVFAGPMDEVKAAYGSDAEEFVATLAAADAATFIDGGWYLDTIVARALTMLP